MICSFCVMTDHEDPQITFNEKGICNHCERVWAQEEGRKAEMWDLPLIYAALRKEGEGKKYDCLLGLSGGVDSSLCLHLLKENDIRVLTFTIDNAWNANDKADANIMKLVEGMKVPFFRYTIHNERFKELQAAFIKAGVKNIEIPSDHIINAAMYELAGKYGIKYIISGGNQATESVMPESYGWNARDLTLIKTIYKKFNNKKLKDLPTISIFQYIYYRFFKKIRVINLLNYYNYNREDAIKLLGEKYGYVPYGEKHCESIFTWWFQSFYLFNKFGLDKRRPHYSSMILSGQMTRGEALRKLNEMPIYPELGIESQVMKYPKHDESEYRNSEWAWLLLGKIYRFVK